MRRALRPAVLGAAVVLLALGPALPGLADEPADPLLVPGQATVQSEDFAAVLEDVRADLAESSEAMLHAAANLRLADQALPGARATVQRTRTVLAQAQARQDRTARERGRAQQLLMLSTRDTEESAAKVVEQQRRLGQLARTLYQGGGSMNEMTVLLASRSPVDFAERMVALRTVTTAQTSVLADFEETQRSFGARTQDLEGVRDQFAAADEQAQRDLQEVAMLAEQADQAALRVSGLVSARRTALATAAAAQAEEDAATRLRTGETSALQAELAGRVRELGAAGATDGSTVPGRPGTLEWPVLGRLSSPFGMRVHPITGVFKLHTGTDLGVACGTPIGAARAGVVIQAGWNSAYGWRTVVSHGAVDGVLITTTYNHQTEILVGVGDAVLGGQVLGSVGSTGYSTGCHLHFEVYVNAALVDPAGWLPAR